MNRSIVHCLAALCAFASNLAVADALTVTVVNGGVERLRIGSEEIVTVRSNATVRFSGAGKVDLLLVGGGGGGGRYAGGGGGGGGVVEMSGIDVMADTDYVITVGEGGAGAIDNNSNGSNGGDSSAFGAIAYGGGGGGTRASGSTGATGGGGGAWGNKAAREGGFAEKAPGLLSGGASACPAQGFAGGSCTNNGHWSANGGGGGGAGGAGFPGRNPASIDGDQEANRGQPGQGGDGALSTLSGAAVRYGGGGGGGGINGHMIARGGLGGGGHGGLYNISCPVNGSVNVTDNEELAGGNGTDGLGGGGGGSCGINTAAAGRGGSGVVVFRYTVDAPVVTGQSVTTLSGTTKTEMFQYDEIVTVFSNARLRVATKGTFDILLVGGGGAGGASDSGGGGGGGGVVYLQNVSVEPGDYDVVIGSGGVYAVGLNRYSRYEGCNGGDTSVFGFTAYGGGGGSTRCSGAFGASGGGAGAWGSGTSRYGITGAGSYSGGGAAYGAQGFAGGSCTNIGHWYAYGGGGGGAGGSATRYYASETDNGMAGAGGAGVACAITGEELYYGGGGGGGATRATQVALGGSGVGGNGGVAVDPNGSKFSATDGMDFRGGGGGGQAGHSYGSIGRGGSGVVILRYRAQTPEDTAVLEDGEATGGDFVRRRGYGLHSFTNDGTFSVSSPAFVDILLVGGGGGGAYAGGGGGGGGGVLILQDVPLKPGSYAVTVGAGGAAGTKDTDAENGGDSSVFGFTAYGGGAGGKGFSVSDSAARAGKSGATGGGGGAWGDTLEAPYPAEGSSPGGVSLYPDQGFGGGSCTNTGRWYSYGGGGGGAGGVGGDAVRNAGVHDEDYGLAGAGGEGRICDITLRNVCYGGGGGGGGVRVNALAPGGAGGGGRGGAYELHTSGVLSDELAAGEDGTDGLGGGGGGGAMLNTESPGRGGCGTIIIRYRFKPRGMAVSIR